MGGTVKTGHMTELVYGGQGFFLAEGHNIL